MDIDVAYREAQRSFVELFRSLDDHEWAAPVPCTPDWTVRDVLSHVAGLADDVLRGNLAGAATDPWTAAQVERWRDADWRGLVAQWDTQVDDVAGALAAFDERRPPIDCHSHEHDVRHALGRPGRRDTELIRWIADGFRGVPVGRPVAVAVDGVTLTIAGEGDPIALSGITRFELARSRLGRRSRAQVAAWDWSTPPTAAELDRWFVFGPASTDIDE